MLCRLWRATAYVALSRCSSLEGLRVLGFSKGKIRADPRVVQFHRDIGDCLPSADNVRIYDYVPVFV